MRHTMFQKRKIFDSIGPEKRTVWGPILPILAIVFLFIGQMATIVPAVETGLMAEEDFEKYPNIIYMLFVPFSAIILITMLWVRFFEGRTQESIGAAFSSNSFRDFRLGYGYGLFMAFIIVCGIWGLGGYERENNAAFELSDSIPLVILLFGFLVQAGAEEYLFRGWLFSRLAERYSVFVGIVGNAVIFALIHLPIVDFSNTSILMLVLSISMSLLFSIFLSLIVLKQKSIWGAVAWHAAWNWLFINMFGLATTGTELGLNPMIADLKAVETAPVWLTGGLIGPEESILTVIMLVVGSILIAKKKIFK
jgi:membrane protease YdiL (CAAX protease family)